MRFSIVTPSYRNSQWLKLCIASVADQKGLPIEHIVQDSCSDDGTQDWLPHDSRVKAFIEKDQGMYDAVNRGYRRASGEFLAYLNCDEQYLPGALKKVSDFFNRNPNVEIVFGDCIVVDGKGNYVCERRGLTPQRLHTLTADSLSFLTAATFIRRSVIEKRQLFFRTDLRDVGDTHWTLSIIQSGLKMAVLPEFLTIFTETGYNMNLGVNAAREKAELRATCPAWARLLAPLILAHYRLRRLRAGHYRSQPYDYSIYTLDSPDTRKTFHVADPVFRWVRPPAPA